MEGARIFSLFFAHALIVLLLLLCSQLLDANGVNIYIDAEQVHSYNSLL